jgi:xanthine dehydrogenase YagS FAD-binding subunit
MRNFAYLRPSSVEEAVTSAAAGAAFIAGGTELLNWMRLGIANPDIIADIGRLGRLQGIALDGDVVRIGSLSTLNEIGTSDVVRRAMPVLSQACLAAASAQLRNLATLGGNVLQKTRCPYFRAEAAGAKALPWPCNKRVAESGCAARDSGYARLALFGATEACVATHPSDPAVALAVLDAIVEISGASGARTMPIADLLLTQEEAAAWGGRRATNIAALENRLLAGEIITGFRVPADAAARRSAYVKVRERQSYEYAMVSAAVAIDLDGDRIRSARVALGSVAQKPWRLAGAERALAGTPLRSESVDQALGLALADARPLKGNEFKIPLARSAAHRALLVAAGAA